jgi:PiT family inorganic phosphate transporter
MPLLISPFLAIGITMTQYPLLRSARRAFGVEKETCVCIGDEIVPVPSGAGAAALMSTRVTVDTTQACVQRYRGAFLAQLPHFEGSNLGKSST